MLRRLPVLLTLAAAVLLGGCKLDVAGFNPNCKWVKGTELHVGQNQTCKFKYGYRDFAKYVVKVTRQPIFGEAVGEGKYLKYTARRDFRGEDRVTIRIERRGVGHVQWETRTVTIKVGPTA